MSRSRFKLKSPLTDQDYLNSGLIQILDFFYREPFHTFSIDSSRKTSKYSNTLHCSRTPPNSRHNLSDREWRYHDQHVSTWTALRINNKYVNRILLYPRWNNMKTTRTSIYVPIYVYYTRTIYAVDLNNLKGPPEYKQNVRCERFGEHCNIRL